MTKNEYLERLSSYKQSFFELDYNNQSITEVLSLKHKGVLGTTKITDFVERERIIYRSAVVANTGAIDLTFSERAKIILLDFVEKFRIKRFRNLNKNDVLIGSYAGFYARNGKYAGCWAYVDIKSFYYSIYKRFLLVQYKRNLFLSDAIKDVSDFFDETSMSKRERVSLFGIMRSTEKTTYRKNKGKVILDRKRVYHNLLNVDLCLLTYDLSKAICHHAVHHYGAVYYNVDGAIIPCEKIEEFAEFLKALGFECSVKDINYNDCIIKGVGVYKVDKPTLNYHYVQLVENKITTNIREEERDFYHWLLKKYQEKNRF